MFKKLLLEHFDILSSILWKYWLLKKKKVWTFYKISPDSFSYKVMIFWKYCDILVMFLFMKVSWENYVTVVCKKVNMAVFQNIAFVTLQIIITRIYHSKKKKNCCQDLKISSDSCLWWFASNLMKAGKWNVLYGYVLSF